MTEATALGLVAALGSALALNWGYWAQHGAAATLPPLSPRRPVLSLRLLGSQPRWAAGFLVGIGGWALYIGALRVAPLSLVQSVSAGGIGVLGLLVWQFGRTRLAMREVVAVAFALLGLVALALSLDSSSSRNGQGSFVAVLAWVSGSVVLAAVIVGTGTRLVRAGAGFGIAAGVLYAAGDVATKAAVGGGARLGLVTVVLACHGLAFVALQLGFQRGGILATAGLASLFTNAVPIVAGLALFGEDLPAGWRGIMRAIAFLAVVAGGAGLARGEAPAVVAEPSRVAATPA